MILFLVLTYAFHTNDLQYLQCFSMDWLSRKLVLWQIKKYFHLENEEQVQVQLLGGHSLTCNNLKLRNTIVNLPSAKIHIQLFTINSLSVVYSSGGEEPLKVSLDGAKLVLAFNPNYVEPPPSYTNTKQQLKSFFDAIKSKEMLHHRGFLSQQAYQLKKLIGEFFIKKVSLLIRNVDVSIQYASEGEVHAMGCELGEVNIKQRTVIAHEEDEHRRLKEEEVICSLEAVALYLGISAEEDKIEQLAYNREILRKTKTIRKNYLMEQGKLQLYYNMHRSSIAITLPELNFKLNKLLLVQLLRTVSHLQTHFSDRPVLRPGKGEGKEIEIGGIKVKMREGTRQWWSYVFKRVLQRVQEKKQFNILTNYKYRQYLFYLLYKFTYGATSTIDKAILEYEEKKLAHSIMSTYALILTRIDLIRNCDSDDEMVSFVNFICGSKIIQELTQKNGLKRLIYDKIKASSNYFNLHNCNEFIRDFANRSNISITLSIQRSVKIECHEGKYDKVLLKEGFTLEPVNFFALKDKYIAKFYKKMTEEAQKWERPIYTLEIGKVQFLQNKSELKLDLPSVLVANEAGEAVLKVSGVLLFKESRTIYSSSNKVVLAEKNNFIKVASVFLNLDRTLAQHLRTTAVLLSDNLVQPLSQQQEFDNYLEDNIYKRLPKHPYFQSFSDQTTSVEVEKMMIVTSLFEEKQCLAIDLTGLDFTSPSSTKPPRLSLQKLAVTRSKISGFDRIRHGRLDKLSVEQESLILENNKPLALTSNKYLRNHNGYNYYESVLDVAIPFLLIQLSFQDLYYFQLLANYWGQLLSSDHLFPKRRGKTQSEMRVISLKQHKIDYFQQLNSFTKSSRTRVKLQGIELILYGENRRAPQNEVFTMLAQGILYENKVYILGADTSFTLFNLFIQNSLGNKTFSRLKLAEIIEQRAPTSQPLIYSNKYQTDASSLLLYGLNDNSRGEERENHMIRVKIKNQFSMKKFRKNTHIYVVIKPLFIYHSPDYYQIIASSLALISRTALRNHRPSFPARSPQQESDHEILQAKNISEKTVLVCEIERVNLVALHQSDPIYTFSFLDLTVKHETEAYVAKYQLLVAELYVVDISVNCGLHPVVLKAVPFQCHFTKYSSDLLKKKERKSALLRISLHNAELYYLNRKIKELTNFIMSHFETTEEEEQRDSSSQKQQQSLPRQYSFCYRVQFVKPVIMLLRSSLSQEKMVSEAESLIIANYVEAGEDIQQPNRFFYDASQQHLRNDSFESCIEIREQEIQFHSFAKAEQGGEEEPIPQIHVSLINYYVYNFQKVSQNAVLFTPEIVITLANKHLKASLKTMNINFSADDYRLLIRITEQNFAEAPVSYPKDSIETQEKNIGFRSSYVVEELNMALRETIGSQKFGQLIIGNVIGENILYSNGEKEDLITVDKMEYESCINGHLQRIIVKKEGLIDLLSDPHELRNRNSSREDTMKKHAEHFADQVDSKAEKQFYKDAQKYNFSEQPEKEAEETMVRGKDKGHAKEETNLNRLGKWIGGMCKKCMCCCKTEAHTDQENGSNQQEQTSQKNEECSKEGALQWENQVDLDESNISSPNEIINFSTKVNPDDYRQQQRKPHSIYLHIRGERSRQKRMYMLVQHLDIYYERNQHVLTLIDFLGRPYQQPERPYYLRDAQFNNYRPFQSLYEVANTSFFAIQKEAIVQRSLQLAAHVLFNMEKVGDPVNGPGKKIMETDLTFKMIFQDKKTQKRTTLSDLIRVIHEKQSFVSYHNHEPVKNIERLLITGTNSDKGQNISEAVVKFNFPIYIIKSLADLGKSLSSQPKKEVKEDINVKVEEKELKPMNKKNQQLELKIQEKGKKQPEKKPATKIISNTTVKKYYIPKVQISIETKETVSFVKLFLEATHLKSREMGKEKCQAKNQTIDLDAYIEYWNLNLGKFEPFLQKCSFMVQQQHLKQESCENTKLRVITKSQKDHNSYDYRNGLCINLTTAFFHTYKELELKYILQNETLQVSNEICYDLTKKGTEAYEYMAMRKQIDRENCESDSFVKRFPEELKNFFGRQFRLQDLTELSKKKSKRNQILKNRFHVQGLKVFLYHSYLQSRTKLKYIIYRTPFRIFNTTPNRLLLKFRLANRNTKLEKWCHEIPSKDYYSVPEDIYQSDFLVSISSRKKSQRDDQLEGSMVNSNKMMEQEGQRTMSVKYLVQMHASKGDYHLMGKHKLNEYLFNLSTLQKLWIDRRDMVLYSNRMTFCVINVKGQCQQHKDKAIEKAKVALYDSWTIAISPIIIYNYTSQNFNLTNCKRKKYELLPSKSVQLNEFPPQVKINQVVVEFLEDPVHHEYRLLDGGIGTQIETMLIDRMQSVNFKTIKETYSTCIVEIYPDWLIINETEFQFHLIYEKKEFIVSEKSTSSLAIAEWRDRKNTAMKLKLIDDLNQQGDFHRFGTETNLIDMFMLSRVEDSDVRLLKQQVQNKGCCGWVKDGQKLSYPEKANDERVFKCVEFVVTIQSSPNYSLTKNLTINYKYWIINQMDFEMVIYQYSSGVTFKIQGEQENGVEILRLKPKEQSYLYTYDFLSNQFYLKVRYEGEFIYSNKFPCNESIGRSLSLKLKKSVNHDIMSSNIAYHESFHHIRIDMQQIKYKNILTFSYIDGEVVKYPFYINNATNYFVKITENGENFKVKPKKRIPFSWSNLINNTHEIEVQIQGESMTYSLKQKSQEFKPIVIKGDNFANNKSSKNISKKLFKREKCLVKWKGLIGEYLVIFDIFAKRLHINSEESVSLLLSDAERLVYTSNKIEIYFDNREIFEFHPSSESIKEWSQLLRNDLNNNIIDKIYFTIESFENSMIYFIHNLELSDNNDVKTDHQEFIVENFFLSVINSNPLRIQEILLINMENIEIILENRLSSIKQEERQSYLVKKSSQIFKIRKLKINNQLKHALNPVVLSQIKKSNYPFLEIRRQKQNLVLWEDRNNNKDQGIEHYKSSIFFLDEAQLIIEGALILESYNFHKSIEQIQRQYAYEKHQENVADPNKDKKVQNNQIYIDYLQIKPIKMTISVSFDANMEKEYQFSLVNFLTLIPSGVQNAIITIDSFVFHHVFMEDNRLRQTLRQYYMYQMKKQILFNAGSIQILTPFQLIRGLGVGFTSIFYNPFYQLVNTKQIKSLTSNMLQGFITFFIFILTLGFSVINGIFKFIAVFTKDNNFQTRRQKFRKQIFKSPMDGFSYGARYLARIFKEFFINFTIWPCQYHQKLPCIGLLFGLLLSIFNIIPWVIKMIITIYDFFYVIGLGFISWGYYEENSMKFRSRPIRTFPHKQLLPYDYLTSKGNEIMRKNLIEENDNEEITFISHIESDDQSKYLLLSNYRILYCSHQLTSFKEITLYKIFKVQVGPLKKNQSGGIDNLYLTVFLTFPDKFKCICVECNTNSYEIKFKDLRSIRDFLEKLKRNLERQKIDFNLEDENLKRYQKSIENTSLKKNEKKSSSKGNA